MNVEKREPEPTAASGGDLLFKPERPAGFGRVLKRYFLTGLLVLLPATISVFVLWRLFFALDRILGQLIDHYTGRHVPGVGLIALLAIIIGIGAVASNIFGRRMIRALERLVERIPILRWIYRTTKQLFSTVLEDRSGSFRKVVLVPFPHKGIYSVAFLTSSSSGVVDQVLGKRFVSVFLPTTPNPTSGYFLMVPEDEVIPLDISVNDGLKLIITAGALSNDVASESAWGKTSDA